MLSFSNIRELSTYRKAFISTQREMTLSILVLCLFTLSFDISIVVCSIMFYSAGYM